ncbi:penicillin-binding protein [Leptospira sp. GIMC2001]|uniref:penicillin-binding protein n=1 Tax=Leptospira sp. GIMC2001 TaxID=1513297 RepID=UPI0004A5C4FB|nr:penicillin-binding transpeptidase domain-containing protein [Leptospira sp. GIMC2001]AID56265.1 cell division protein FtsI [Leptospira sp. GIMC2001]WCL49320.1 penicillin-binding transpeptidase domain-containing protein [Leptospira sp. GIMC2001]
MEVQKRRLTILIGIILSLFLILLVRVAYLAFFNEKIKHYQVNKHVRRGMIVDRRGIELALSTEASTIGINPSNVYDIPFTAKYLSEPLEIPTNKLEAILKEKSSYFLLKREIDKDLGKKIANLSLPGVRIEKEFKRIYPQGALASNLIGFTGLDDDRALSGLEKEFNLELLTTPSPEIERGNDIHLTLDSLMQYKLEKSLAKAFKQTQSSKAIGIFMDIYSGHILAMASFPNFDPNRYSDFPATNHTNWAIRHVYEPGSTMKIFIALMLINEGVLSTQERFYCPGYVEFGSSMIRCTDKHGSVNLEEILQFSCNVGIIKASQKISDKRFYEYLKKFRFGSKTGFAIHENKGFLPNVNDWRQGTPYFLSIGQGLSVTPIQLVASAAGVVNGGYFVDPKPVSKITNTYGELVHQFGTRSESLNIKKSSTDVILKAMTKAVKSGTGKNAYLQDITIAGKTGTGQKATAGKGYQPGLWSASFLGFFPAEKPQIVGLVLFDEPAGDVYSGGGLAAPVFKDVVEGILPMLDQRDSDKSYRLKRIQPKKFLINPNYAPNLIGLTLSEAIAALNSIQVRFTVSGSGFVKEQTPAPGTMINDKSVIRLILEK